MPHGQEDRGVVHEVHHCGLTASNGRTTVARQAEHISPHTPAQASQIRYM